MPQNVLFLCTGNSARSILAEAILNHRANGRFTAFSAGSQPSGSVRAEALALLASLDITTTNLRSKSWNEFALPTAPPLDFIITVCDNAAAEACPFWPGHPATAHWGIPDPAAAIGTPARIAEAYRDAFTLLDRRIALFLALPFATLSPQNLHRELESIGQA